MRWALASTTALLIAWATASGQIGPAGLEDQRDTDNDGLSDALEQQLLEGFAPSFMVARNDCSGLPAEFAPNISDAVVERQNGTIYGQAFPHAVAPAGTTEVELHFYHLWSRDCGAHGHSLDAEHVSVLVRAPEPADGSHWKALYWYAAAHEDTVCDVTQIARASTLNAVDKGATVWVSPGKHASYLNERLCSAGCGADRCEALVPLTVARVINLGEVGHPMNSSLFISSMQWSLAGKMGNSNFPAEPLARLERMPETQIALFNAGRHPAQGVISISSTTEDALGKAGSDTASSLGIASDSTGDAIGTAGDSTGNALGTSYRKTIHALGLSARHVGHALGISAKPVKGTESAK
jgi:hypothetical protein